MISRTLPVRTSNPLNGSHGHWAATARKRKGHRKHAGLIMRSAFAGNAACGPPPWTVTITRIAPSKGLDPHDGLGAALKGVIDGVADALGIDDRDSRVTWVLQQERGPWGVRIEVA